MTDDSDALTAFQLEVAQLFFALPASEEFLLAGKRHCSRGTSPPVRPRTWTSSLGPAAVASSRHGMSSSRPRETVAGAS